MIAGGRVAEQFAAANGVRGLAPGQVAGPAAKPIADRDEPMDHEPTWIREDAVHHDGLVLYGVDARGEADADRFIAHREDRREPTIPKGKSPSKTRSLAATRVAGQRKDRRLVRAG